MGLILNTVVVAVLTSKCMLSSTTVLSEKLHHPHCHGDYNLLHSLSISEVCGKRKLQNFRDEEYYISSVPQNQVCLLNPAYRVYPAA